MEKDFSKRLEEKNRSILIQKEKLLTVAGKKIATNKIKTLDEMSRLELTQVIQNQKNQLNFMSDVFFNLPYILLILDERYTILFANDLANNLLVETNNSLINNSFLSLLSKEEDVQIWNDLNYQEYELILRFKRGEFKTCSIKKVKNEQVESSDKKYFVFINDISDEVKKKQVQDQIKNMSLLSDIASGIAHELRNPLAGVKLNADTLEEYLTDPSYKEFTKRISKEIDRANNLLKLFFKYAHPNKGSKSFISPEFLITSALHTIETLCFTKKIKFTTFLDSLLPHIFVDANQIELVLYQILKNAVESINQEVGLIEIIISLKPIEIKTNKEFIEFRIRNNGEIISIENQNKLFQPFFTTKFDRVGLGLATSKRLAIENGGDIFLHGSNEQETIFILLLPTS